MAQNGRNRRRGGWLALAATAVGLGLVAGACGGSGGPSNPEALLKQADVVFAKVRSAHLTFASRNLPLAGTILISGTADAARPATLTGTFQLALNGAPLSLQAVETGGKFYVKLPFAAHWQAIQPQSLGLKDPASYIDPNTGIGPLLGDVTGARSGGQERINGELVDVVNGTIAADLVGPFLPGGTPPAPVAVSLAIDPSSKQLRQVTITGQFPKPGDHSTYVITLTKYDEPVRVTAPKTG